LQEARDGGDSGGSLKTVEKRALMMPLSFPGIREQENAAERYRISENASIGTNREGSGYPFLM
jgi:hypothetical protein